MYRDDYIKFKDLFQPENNSQLKSFGTTKFAKRFRETVSQGLKSSDSFDLEQFLIDNDLMLYVPYPVEDYPTDKQVPTITYHPLDNDSVNIGYRLSMEKSTNQIETVPRVNEDYSKDYPVYIIAPDPGDGGGTGGGTNTGGGNTGSGTGTSDNDPFSVKLAHMRVTKQYDPLFRGGSEFLVTLYYADRSGNSAYIDSTYSGILNFKRSEIRKMRKGKMDYKYIGITLHPSWKVEQIENYLTVIEDDTHENGSEGTINVKVKIKIGPVELTPGLTSKYISKDYPIVKMKLDRTAFLKDERDHSRQNGSYAGNVVRNLNTDVSITTHVYF